MIKRKITKTDRAQEYGFLTIYKLKNYQCTNAYLYWGELGL